MQWWIDTCTKTQVSFCGLSSTVLFVLLSFFFFFSFIYKNRVRFTKTQNNVYNPNILYWILSLGCVSDSKSTLVLIRTKILHIYIYHVFSYRHNHREVVPSFARNICRNRYEQQQPSSSSSYTLSWFCC